MGWAAAQGWRLSCSGPFLPTEVASGKGVSPMSLPPVGAGDRPMRTGRAPSQARVPVPQATSTKHVTWALPWEGTSHMAAVLSPLAITRLGSGLRPPSAPLTAMWPLGCVEPSTPTSPHLPVEVGAVTPSQSGEGHVRQNPPRGFQPEAQARRPSSLCLGLLTRDTDPHLAGSRRGLSGECWVAPIGGALYEERVAEKDGLDPTACLDVTRGVAIGGAGQRPFLVLVCAFLCHVGLSWHPSLSTPPGSPGGLLGPAWLRAPLCPAPTRVL